MEKEPNSIIVLLEILICNNPSHFYVKNLGTVLIHFSATIICIIQYKIIQ